MVLMLIVSMMRLMAMVLTLESFVHVHLVILVTSTAIEHAMVLPMVAVIVHATVWVMRRRVRARRPIRRRCVGVRLKECSTITDWRAVAMV